jgi:hypothetical protein
VAERPICVRPAVIQPLWLWECRVCVGDAGSLRWGYGDAAAAADAGRRHLLVRHPGGDPMTCLECDLPDPYNGEGDGIGSCECPRCEWCHGPPLECECESEDAFPDWPDDVFMEA